MEISPCSFRSITDSPLFHSNLARIIGVSGGTSGMRWRMRQWLHATTRGMAEHLSCTLGSGADRYPGECKHLPAHEWDVLDDNAHGIACPCAGCSLEGSRPQDVVGS